MSVRENMASAIRTIGHEDQLSLVDHLDELRTRLIVSVIAFAIAFGICLWQNHALLRIINEPLKTQTSKQVARGEGTTGQAVLAQQAVIKVAEDTRSALDSLVRPKSGLSAATRAELVPVIAALQADVRRLPRNPQGDNPVTLGVGEPFTTTLTVSFFFALIIALPVILWELLGFVLPALSPRERRAAVPLLAAIPFLFVAGVLFGYFVVLPAAVRFFVNFNASEFNILVQASQFYGFAATLLLAMGLIFQVPILILGATRLGLVTPQQLRKGRRFAIVACAAVAAFLPGDAVTLVLETIPLYILYEASILLATLMWRADAGVRDEGGARSSASSDPGATSDAGEPADPTVEQMIDHVDPRL